VIVADTTSDGPLFSAVTVTMPVVPGVMAGVVALITRSATRGPMRAAEVPVSLPGVGSAVGEVAEAVPPVSETPGMALAGAASRMSIVLDVSAARGPAIVQESGPAKGPVQPGGRATIVAPTGGE
jgi:hypothetical protein